MRRRSLISEFGLFQSFVVVALAGILTVGVVSGFGSAPPQTAAQVAAAKLHTVTYVVTGTRSWVNYGYWVNWADDLTRDMTHTGPLSVTVRIPHPIPWLRVDALTTKSRVACEILVDGRVVARNTASGDYGEADCEVKLPTANPKPTAKPKK